MKLRFTKMQGAGNDFVMLDGIGQSLALDPERLRWIADRRYGVGADQILVVERAADPGVDFHYRIFNANGGEVEQCGNGARCFVKFVHQLGLSRQRRLRVSTAGGVIEPALEDNGLVSVDMGSPDFDPAAVGFDARGLQAHPVGRARLWPLTVGGHDVQLCVVSIGNPHAVQFVPDLQTAPVTVVGPLLEHDARFAGGVNAGFAQVLDRTRLRLRVWERGVGETLACGTGACAAAAAAMRLGLVDSPLTVHTRGGDLGIAWNDDGLSPSRARLRLSGPAEKVFEGELDLP